MKVAGIKVGSPAEAKRVRWILGVHAGAAACGGVSLAWLIALILFTSHEGECGGYEVQHDENLGKWHTSRSDSFSIGFVCERTAELGCLSSWSRFQGSCYTMVCESSSYDEAVEKCKKRGALLVSVNSEIENRFVQELCGRQSCWIGLERPPGSAMWQWADGTILGLWDNWTYFNNYEEGVDSSWDKTCLNKGPPERFIEEPAFIIKAVGKFVVPSCLMFLAYLALKRRSNDLTQCICIVDGFAAACLFAEMVIMIFRLMKGGPWYDVVAYVLFLAVASCGVAFCCACSAKALSGLKAQMAAELADKNPEERTAMMPPESRKAAEVPPSMPAVKYTSKAQNPVTLPDSHRMPVDPERPAPHQVALQVRDGQPPRQGQAREEHAGSGGSSNVPPQAVGNTELEDDFAIADEMIDADPEPMEPRSSRPQPFVSM